MAYILCKPGENISCGTIGLHVCMQVGWLPLFYYKDSMFPEIYWKYICPSVEAREKQHQDQENYSLLSSIISYLSNTPGKLLWINNNWDLSMLHFANHFINYLRYKVQFLLSIRTVKTLNNEWELTTRQQLLVLTLQHAHNNFEFVNISMNANDCLNS